MGLRYWSAVPIEGGRIASHQRTYKRGENERAMEACQTNARLLGLGVAVRRGGKHVGARGGWRAWAWGRNGFPATDWLQDDKRRSPAPRLDPLIIIWGRGRRL